MNSKKLAVAYFFGLLSAISISNKTVAQAISYKANQVIRLGVGESLEVIRCSDDEGEQFCQFRHLVNNKQVGKPFWLKSANVASRRTSQKPITVAVNKRISTQTKGVIRELPVTKIKTTANSENAGVQADMLSMAKMVAQTSVQQQPEIIAKETNPEPAPKKVKKEFVSLNPYLQKKSL